MLNIPAHHIFFGVSGIIQQTIIGPSRWQLGVSGGLNRFGTDLPLTVGSTVQGPANPPDVYWQDTPLVLTPTNGSFLSGQLVLEVFSLSLPIPS